jgi:pimeloyl-ACP methyl ester carboxylesterase
MHYVSRGRGAPPLVFVHGFTCDHSDWEPQMEAFERTHRVVACDLRGHGSTPGRPAECTIGHFGGDVAALLVNLDFPKSILVGHSMGCRVVLEAARLDPARVSAIVLVDGSRMGGGDPRQAEEAMRTAIRLMGYPDFAEALLRQMFLRPSAQAERIIARAKRMPADIGMAAWLSLVRWDAEHMDAALSAVRAPLWVIQSTWVNAERKRAPLKAGQMPPWFELIKQHVPAARLEVVPDTGHFTQLEAAQTVNRLIGEACRSAGAP